MKCMIAVLVAAVSIVAQAGNEEVVFRTYEKGSELFSSSGGSQYQRKPLARQGYVLAGYQTDAELWTAPVKVEVDAPGKKYGLTKLSGGDVVFETVTSPAGMLFVAHAEGLSVCGVAQMAGSVPLAARMTGRGAWGRMNTDGSSSTGQASLTWTYDRARSAAMSGSGSTSARVLALVETAEPLPGEVLSALGLAGYTRGYAEVPVGVEEGSVLNGRTITGGTIDGAVIGFEAPCAGWFSTLRVGTKESSCAVPVKDGYEKDLMTTDGQGNWSWCSRSAVLDRAYHTGKQMSDTIADFESRVKTIVSSMKTAQSEEVEELKTKVAELEARLGVKGSDCP